MSEPTPLFVCGCARSGTTALAQLLGAHPAILMGVERYGRLTRDEFLLQREHLTPARFARIETGDTFYEAFAGRYGWDAHFDAKLAGERDLAFVGDKKPRLYRHWRRLFSVFPEAVLVGIHRDPVAVALSWETRAREPGGNWPPRWGAAAAIDEWNRSVACLRDARAAGHRVLLVPYDRLNEAAVREALFAALGLALPGSVQALADELDAANARAVEALAARRPVLDDRALSSLRAAVDPGHEEWLRAQAGFFAPAAAGG